MGEAAGMAAGRASAPLLTPDALSASRGVDYSDTAARRCWAWRHLCRRTRPVVGAAVRNAILMAHRFAVDGLVRGSNRNCWERGRPRRREGAVRRRRCGDAGVSS